MNSYRPSSFAQTQDTRHPSTWGSTCPVKSNATFSSPWVILVACGKQLRIVGLNFNPWKQLLPSLVRGNEWHSPVAPVGNRRPGTCGSAYGQKGHPLRGWCIYQVLTLTLRVWPGGLLGLLCTRDGDPPETTWGSIAVDYKGKNRWLENCSWYVSQGKTNFDIKLTALSVSFPVLTSTDFFKKLSSVVLVNI